MSLRESHAEVGLVRTLTLRRRLIKLVVLARSRAFGRSGGGFFLALTSVNVFNFGFHFAMSRLLGPSRYGGLAALVSIVAVLSIPLAAFEAAVIHVAAEHPERSHRSLLRGTIAAGLVGLLAWASVSAWTSYFLHIPVTTVLLLAPWVMFAVINSAQEGILIGRRRYKAAGVGVLFGTGIVRLLSAVMLVEAGAGTAGAIASTAIGAAACAGILALPLRQQVMGEPLTVDRQDLIRAVSGVSGVTLLTSLDVWLARHFLTTVQAGYFSAAATAGRITLFLPSALLFVVFPRFASGSGGGLEAARELRRALLLTTVLSGTAAAVLIGAPHLVSGLLFGQRYGGTASVVGIIGLADASAALLTVLIYFQMARRSRLANVSWVGCGLAVLLALLFHGTPSALALAMLGSNISITGLMLVTTGISARNIGRRSHGYVEGTEHQESPPSQGRQLASQAWQALGTKARRGTHTSPTVYSRLGWVPYAILTAAVAVVEVTWWRSSALVWGSDGAFPIRLDEVSRYFSLGLTAPVGADARKVAYILPWGIIWEAWRLAGLPWSAAIVQRLVDGGLLLASGIGAMRLSRRCWPIVHPAAALSAGLFYMFNLFALTTVWTSQSNLIYHYSFLPLGVLVVLWAFESGSSRKTALAAVTWTMLFSPAYISTPILVTDLCLLAGLGILVATRRPATWLIYGRSVITFGLVLLAMNAYWIYVLIKYFSLTFSQGLASTQGAASQMLFVLNSAPLISALHLGGYFGIRATFLGSHSFPWQGWYSGLVEALGVIPMALAAFAIFRLRTHWNDPTLRHMRAYKFFFATLLVVTVFLVTGGHAPLGGTKVELFTVLHLLDEFRSVYERFMEYLPLAIAPLFAAGVHLVLKFALDARQRAIRWGATCAVGAVVLTAVVIVPLPLWAGWLYDGSGVLPSNRITPPEAYLRAARIVQRDAGRSAVLTLPIGSTAETFLNWQGGKAGYTGIQPISFMTSASVIDTGGPTTWAGRALSRLHGTPAKWCSTLSALNVRFVILETDVNRPFAQAESVAYGSDPQLLKSTLDGIRCLSAHRLSSSVTLYRNTDWVPYAVFAASTASGGNPVAVRYRAIGPDRLEVQLPRAKPYLVVNQPYDANLRLDGRAPLSSGPLTTFRAPTGGETTVVVSNPVTSGMRYLLYGASGLALLAVGLNIPGRSLRKRLTKRQCE